MEIPTQVSTLLLEGKPVAKFLKEQFKQDVEALANKGITPGLAAILVGDDPASQVYVRNKQNAFKRLQCYSETFKLPEETTEEELSINR